MTNWKARRDELELKYMEDQREKGELNSRHMDDLPAAFSTGFEAGLKFALECEEVKDLVRAYRTTHFYYEGSGVDKVIDQFNSFKESVE